MTVVIEFAWRHIGVRAIWHMT